MNRLAPTGLLCLLFLAGGWVQAQKVQFRQTGTVIFEPTADDYFASLECQAPDCLSPTLGSPPIAVKVLRQSASSYALSVSQSGLPDGLELLAQYQVSGNQSQPFTTPWLNVGTAPSVIFVGNDPKTDADVSVTYQLRSTGEAVAGVHTVSVNYSVAGSSVSHDLRIGLEAVIALRINGVVVGSAATLYFDYSGDLLAYMKAITDGTPLQLTSSELESVEVFTNNPTGYTTLITVTQVSGPTTGSLDTGDVWLSGIAASGSVLSSSGPTGGFTELALPDDFAVAVSGGETPGEYMFELTYQAQMNP